MYICHENFKKRKHGNMGITNEIDPFDGPLYSWKSRVKGSQI